MLRPQAYSCNSRHSAQAQAGWGWATCCGDSGRLAQGPCCPPSALTRPPGAPGLGALHLRHLVLQVGGTVTMLPACPTPGPMVSVLWTPAGKGGAEGERPRTEREGLGASLPNGRVTSCSCFCSMHKLLSGMSNCCNPVIYTSLILGSNCMYFTAA